MNDVWDMLGEPFPPEDLQWRVEALSKDKRKALMVPYISHRALMDRLDEVVGVEGWQDSYEVLQTQAPPDGSYAVKCRLRIMDVCKEDVGEGDSFKAAFAEAFLRAAAKFGAGRSLLLEPQWVEHNPSEPSQAKLAGTVNAYNQPAVETPAEHPEPSVRPGLQELIDRLLERLKHAGLGKQAALIVMKYGGYGKHPEETRKLYGELRALLKGQAS